MYKLDKKNHKYKTEGILELIGYKTKINKQEIEVYDQDLIDKLIKLKLVPEFNKVVKKILIFLEEDNDADSTVLYLDELARIYALYLNKYERFLSKKEKEKFMKDLRILTNELKSLTHKKVKNIVVRSGRRR